MKRFFAKWIGVTIIISIVILIAFLDGSNPDNLLGGLLLVVFFFPFSMAIMGLVWWRLLPKQNKSKLPGIIISLILVLPFVLVCVFAVRYSAESRRNAERLQRLVAHTVHTHVLSVEVEDYTDDQIAFLRIDARALSVGTRTMNIEDEISQQNFHTIFGVQLPKIDFDEYFFRVFPGQAYDGWRGTIQGRRVDPYTINVYQVNIVR